MWGPVKTTAVTRDPVAPEAPARRIDRAELKNAARYCAKVFLSVRIGLAVLAMIAVALVPQNSPADVPGWPAPRPEPGWSTATTAWERWDGLWFLRIADEGYRESDGSAAFFPLYPLVTGAVSLGIGDHPLPASIIVSNLALFAALVAFYLLSRLEWDEATARRAVLYMAVFPTAFFFLAPYSESLFLLLAASSVLFARMRRWLPAALLGALAGATRSIGIVLIPTLLVEAYLQWRVNPSRKPTDLLGPAAASLFVGAGTFAYLLFWKLFGDNWWAPVGEQGNWQREFSFLTRTIINGTRNAIDYIGLPNGGYFQIDWLLVAVVIACTVWVVRRARATYTVYTLLSVFLPMSFVFASRPFMSVPRFAIVIWPLFWALARFSLGSERRHELVLAASCLGLGVMTVLFVNWYFVF